MDDEPIFFFIGCFVGVIITIIVGLFLGATYRGGYQQAYTDLHQNKIEHVVKRDYPSLWIKFNVPDPPSNEIKEYGSR